VAWAIFRYFRHTNVQANFMGVFVKSRCGSRLLVAAANIFWTKIAKNGHCGRVE